MELTRVGGTLDVNPELVLLAEGLTAALDAPQRIRFLEVDVGQAEHRGKAVKQSELDGFVEFCVFWVDRGTA